MTEEQLQIQVAAYLDLALTCPWWHTPNGGHRSKAIAGKLKAAGAKPGVADILILFDGALFCIELKAERGHLSLDQRSWRDTVEDHGALYAVCRSLENVQGVLKGWSIPVRAAVAA